MTPGADDTFLQGLRVLEIGDELGEYCGKLLAGLGADVVKVEPPGGEKTRGYGPFLDDEPGPERSLYFWHYNFGKRGVALDLETDAGREAFRKLAAKADVILDGRPRGWLAERGLDYDDLKAINPGLIFSRISPFGDEGPWADFRGSDLVHLALGGMMVNCGYDPEPDGTYETPPIAPQMWHSYHVAGEMAAMALMGALTHRLETGEGQRLSTAVHTTVAQQTEGDVPSWIFLAQPHFRSTCRHSRYKLDQPVLTPTKDGRYLYPYRSYAAAGVDALTPTIAILDKNGMAEDLTDPKYKDRSYTANAAVENHVFGVVQRFVQRFMFDKEIWREFQAAGLTWAPIRKPEENTRDEHWRARETFLEVERPELGRTFTEVGAKWMCLDAPWRKGPRSPLLGEHTDQVLKEWGAAEAIPPRPKPTPGATPTPNRGALDGVKFLDLGWMLASAGAGRFLAAMGADVIKVEHKSRWDALRFARGLVGPGGRPERDAATGPLPDVKPTSPNRGGFFMDINAGKRAISLNLKTPRARELFFQMVEKADVVGEGFSPGAMDRMGLGYDKLKAVNPRIVYVQQSGMGQIGLYGEMRSYGPVAQAFSGVSEMSGLPEPFPPAGIGYSFLDWCGAYNLANAILAGLYRQKLTGKGCWIDSSQVEAGTYLNGTAILDHSANGRSWSRYGNRSPYKLAAPHGAFQTKGVDRWIAIACFDDAEWRRLVEVLGAPAWAEEPRFATLADRLAHQDELEARLNAATREFEPYALMERLQAAGVPAGVCQDARDRCDFDPQLKAQNWLVELEQSEIGRWPAKEFPTAMSGTPAHMGGFMHRHGPNYAEDNEAVFGEWLGLSTKQVRELEEEGVL
jgi:crotonobetainyl-CoA:carnitine CoA-transferase CaiB-like acyl-CoA transferase